MSNVERAFQSLQEEVTRIEDGTVRGDAERLLDAFWKICGAVIDPKGSPSGMQPGSAGGGAGPVRTKCPRCGNPIILT